MARSIAVNQPVGYRSVRRLKDRTNGKTVDSYEGIFPKPGTAQQRVSFWTNYYNRRGDDMPQELVDAWVEEARIVSWRRLGGPSLPEPTVNSRGFLSFGGGPIKTTYGHDMEVYGINVYESSAARAPHVWVATEASPEVNSPHAHLCLSQAILLCAALDQFIQGVPERWEHGQRLLDAAYEEAFAPVPEEDSSSKV